MPFLALSCMWQISFPKFYGTLGKKKHIEENRKMVLERAYGGKEERRCRNISEWLKEPNPKPSMKPNWMCHRYRSIYNTLAFGAECQIGVSEPYVYIDPSIPTDARVGHCVIVRGCFRDLFMIKLKRNLPI
ncbi:hypothetical protein B0O99DRAFT_596036 [Bisporella sp. PMI_857]|nr:hypothetical protein B0O99DRAFT_596036 [Bisporella sp. PMI_857]